MRSLRKHLKWQVVILAVSVLAAALTFDALGSRPRDASSQLHAEAHAYGHTRHSGARYVRSAVRRARSASRTENKRFPGVRTVEIGYHRSGQSSTAAATTSPAGKARTHHESAADLYNKDLAISWKARYVTERSYFYGETSVTRYNNRVNVIVVEQAKNSVPTIILGNGEWEWIKKTVRQIRKGPWCWHYTRGSGTFVRFLNAQYESPPVDITSFSEKAVRFKDGARTRFELQWWTYQGEATQIDLAGAKGRLIRIGDNQIGQTYTYPKSEPQVRIPKKSCPIPK